MILDTGYNIRNTKRSFVFNTINVYVINKSIRVYIRKNEYAVCINGMLAFTYDGYSITFYHDDADTLEYRSCIFNDTESIARVENNLEILDGNCIANPWIFSGVVFITPYSIIRATIKKGFYRYNYGRWLYLGDIYVGAGVDLNNTAKLPFIIWLTQI